jgi:Fe2+ or Zn2+ uptake regulation protein
MVTLHMASAQAEQMDENDLTKTDRAILDTLQENRETGEPWGIATKGRLVDETGFSRNSVYNRLQLLNEAGHIELIHEGTREFRFVSDPRQSE